MKINLFEKYKKNVIPEFKKQFGCTNNFEVPKLVKAVLNIGIGKYLKDPKLIEALEQDLSSIIGQKFSNTQAKKSIASFKIRENMVIGMKCTLRGKKMYDFLEKLINVALPRTRDFRGLDVKSIDTKGNFTLGIKEHIIFPEVSNENIKTIFSFEVSMATTAKNKIEAETFFRMMGFPLKAK